MMTVTRYNQDDSSQDADHGYQFNNIGFIDDRRNANFARRGAGVHNMAWHGDQR